MNSPRGIYQLICILFTCFIFLQHLSAQNPNKKTLGHEELATWNKIVETQISNDGNWVVYTLKPEEGNPSLKIYNHPLQRTYTFDRSEKAKISADNQFVVFKTKPHLDSLKAMKRRKVKKEDLPKDTLTIFNLNNRNIEQIPNINSFKMPEKWSGWLAYNHEPISIDTISSDTIQVLKKRKKKKKKKKKWNKENGRTLSIKNLSTGTTQDVPYVRSYVWAKEGQRLALNSTGKDSTFDAGVYLFDVKKNELKPLYRKYGHYKTLVFDEKGEQLAFVADLDTTDAQIRPFDLHYWQETADSAKIIATNTAQFLPKDWLISEYFKPKFSKDGTKLFFGMTPPPILEDTLLLDEEKVNVEVWSYQDSRLHTQQKVNLSKDKKRAYQVIYHPKNQQFIPLHDEDLPELNRGQEGNADIALAYRTEPYLKETSWEGWPAYKDLYTVDVNNGQKKLIAKKIRGNVNLSPNADYVYWYSYPDTAWFAYSVEDTKIRQLTNKNISIFYDEMNDRPMLPYSYSIAGWLENDKYVLINDRYDIWKIDPTGKEKAINLTKGRVNKIAYRYIKLDKEERSISSKQKLLLSLFDHTSKASGYASLSLKNGELKQLIKEDYKFNRRLIKAKESEALVFTKENFQVFPNLQYTNVDFSKKPTQISDANPQQSDYSWGSIELYEWTSLEGKKLQGLLVKPEGFDPNKKYPMIVNFYERYSNRLHDHRAPYPHRSTINYAFYASKGYVIFNPDVPYRIGYPGESAENSVIPGITSLIDKGFVDKDRIGAQGHSWGGYQVAHLATKTDIFKCIESGAPVVNMVSAYGGIRWGSGMSRMFQYEHTQSRIGGTLWEYPLRYIENSPIFTLDKINTPILILHNDKDGAVPWYQGIEFFVGLRRLGKPAWLLNYNDEPHWPTKLQNRRDFNIRMQQFFDYYLKDTPMPRWMKRGVPAMEKGILQGLGTE